MEHKKDISQRKGFTLIEVMVSISIFVIVMMVAVGAVLSAVDANRKTQALASVMNNMSVAVESMVRDMRTGTNYDVRSASRITFDNTEGIETTYRLSGNKILKNVAGQELALTADEIVVEGLTFTPSGVGNDNKQPIVLVQIRGYSGAGKSKSEFNLQTLVSQRLLEN